MVISISTCTKFPKYIINELNDFVKGADSNVKYTSFYITKNINEDFGKLHNYLFSKEFVSDCLLH